MSKNVLSLHVEEMEKSTLDPDPNQDQFQNLIDMVLGQRSIISQNLVRIGQ